MFCPEIIEPQYPTSNRNHLESLGEHKLPHKLILFRKISLGRKVIWSPMCFEVLLFSVLEPILNTTKKINVFLWMEYVYGFKTWILLTKMFKEGRFRCYQILPINWGCLYSPFLQHKDYNSLEKNWIHS